ncbi:MAG TPA: cyclic nucleotide-binding domain-containing protein [Microthrixaceae bacterium]|nr:cyclic nucleotide-binding domain-containing protein [Microthrixaceae bacterium]
MTNLVDEVASIRLFSACTKRDLQRLAKAVDHANLKAGDELTRQGSVGREAFVILSGTATVLKDGVEVATLGKGDHVGELALLDGGPRSATVRADSEMEVLVLSKPAFNAVLDEIPGLAHKLLISLAERLRESEQSLSH